jgi:MFS family permease
MSESHDPYRALRHREYRWFLIGSMPLFMAAQIQSLVMGWQVYEITHDPLSLGLIGLAEAIPFLGLSLLGGWAADRHERRRLSMAAIGLLLTGALALLLLNAKGRPSAAWPFYLVQALAGLARAFYRPAYNALGTELVPREAYQNAATWRSSVFFSATVIGPAVGGLLYAFGGAQVAYGCQAAFIAFSLFSLSRVRPRPRPAVSPAPLLASMAEGVRFVLSHRLVLSALSLDLFAVLFGGAVALLPAFASDILHVGPRGLGLLRAAPAVGSVLMSLVLAHWPPKRGAGKVLLLCVAGFGLTWIGFAWSTSMALSWSLLAIGGALDNVSVVLRGTLVQMETPPEMMGRVQAINGFFIGSSNELGAFESGLAARLLGMIPSVIFGGCMTLVVVAITAWRVPELRRLVHLSGEQRKEAAAK